MCTQVYALRPMHDLKSNGIMLVLLIVLWAAVPARAAEDLGGTIVYLMDWKYEDIAKECMFLGKYGFSAVVTSPPTENVVLEGRPWHERYQVVSYKLQTRSGDKKALEQMIVACLRSNVRVLVDIVLNNMAYSKQDKVVGTAGSEATPVTYEYPDFNRKSGHFNNPCPVFNYQDMMQVRACEIEFLADLSQGHPYVRKKQVDLLNELIAIGVSGFIFDKAKFMFPWDLAMLQGQLNDVDYPTEGTRPIMLFNIEDPAVRRDAWDAVSWTEYVDMGRVSDYKYGIAMRKYFEDRTNFFDIISQGTLHKRWMPSPAALVYLSNIYTHTKTKSPYIKYNERPEIYKLASALMLAYNFGQPLVLSTYKMLSYERGGPPSDAQGKILSPGFHCSGGWNCEHRLPEIFRMSFFRLQCGGEMITDVQGTGMGKFAFGRGKKGFVAFNFEKSPWAQKFATSLPEGEYCEVMTGGLKRSGWSKGCADKADKIKVDATGSFDMVVPPASVRAIHTWNMIGFKAAPGEGPPVPILKTRGLFRKMKDLVYFSFAKGEISDLFPTAAPPGTS